MSVVSRERYSSDSSVSRGGIYEKIVVGSDRRGSDRSSINSDSKSHQLLLRRSNERERCSCLMRDKVRGRLDLMLAVTSYQSLVALQALTVLFPSPHPLTSSSPSWSSSERRQNTVPEPIIARRFTSPLSASSVSSSGASPSRTTHSSWLCTV